MSYDDQLDDFGPLDSDPYEGDRDEYEPGGLHFDRDSLDYRGTDLPTGCYGCGVPDDCVCRG